MSNESEIRNWVRKSVRLGKITCAVLLLALSVFPGFARAQVLYGSLTGNVTDPSKAAVPGAQIEALNIGTGVSRTTTTDEGGVYRFEELQPGTYKVTITATNFGPKAIEKIRVDANNLVRV